MSLVTTLFWLFLLATSVSVLWALAQAAVASALGARPFFVRLGLGPTLIGWRMADIQWQLRLLPAFGSAVIFQEPKTQTDETPPDRLNQLPLGLYMLAVLLPWGITLLVAVVCLGAPEALRQFVSGFAFPFEVSRLPDRAERFVAMVRGGELMRAWGLVAAKVTAINLLPLPTLAGGKALFGKWRNPMPVWIGLLAALALVVMLPWALYVVWLVIKALA